MPLSGTGADKQGTRWIRRGSAGIAIAALVVGTLTMGVVGPRIGAPTVVGLGPELPLPETGPHPIQPIEPPVGLDPMRVELGRKLFHDSRLSGTGRMSCASCHELRRFGVDGRPRSIGAQGELSRNAPTVYNAALQFRQFWDGRAVTLEEQVDGPLLSPGEMGATWDLVLERLRGDPDLLRRFRSGYGKLDADAVRHAIAEFERSLLTPGAPFDRYLQGDSRAIGDLAKEGYRLFRRYGCASCHQGVGVGGNMFQRFGVMRVPSPTGVDDLGRFLVTGAVNDEFVFKVPSLRNVYETAPYFHNGSVATLREAVQVMAEAQLGIRLDSGEVRAILAFLKSLTGVRPR